MNAGDKSTKNLGVRSQFEERLCSSTESLEWNSLGLGHGMPLTNLVTLD